MAQKYSNMHAKAHEEDFSVDLKDLLLLKNLKGELEATKKEVSKLKDEMSSLKSNLHKEEEARKALQVVEIFSLRRSLLKEREARKILQGKYQKISEDLEKKQVEHQLSVLVLEKKLTKLREFLKRTSEAKDSAMSTPQNEEKSSSGMSADKADETKENFAVASAQSSLPKALEVDSCFRAKNDNLKLPDIYNFVCLPNGLLVFSDNQNYSLRVFQQEREIGRTGAKRNCALAVFSESLVAATMVENRLTFMRVTEKHLRHDSSFSSGKKNYHALAVLNETKLAGAYGLLERHDFGIDLIILSGNTLGAKSYLFATVCANYLTATPGSTRELIYTHVNEISKIANDTFQVGAQQVFAKSVHGSASLTGLCTDRQGNIFVCDSRTPQLYVLDPNGKKMRRILPASVDVKNLCGVHVQDNQCILATREGTFYLTHFVY